MSDEPAVGKRIDPRDVIPLFFVQASTTPDPVPREIREELRRGFGDRPEDPDAEGWAWVDVWFDRPGAEELARRQETRRVWVSDGSADDPLDNREISEEIVTVARVVSAAELIDTGGYEALGRAAAAVAMQMSGRLEQLKAGVRFGEPH